MRLNELSDNPGATQPRKRLGRGIGSGLGKTSGKGHKGAKARKSNNKPRSFEGGQMPIYRRLPKRGFKNVNRADYVVINVDQIQAALESGRLPAGGVIDANALVEAGILRRTLDGVRLLGRGEITLSAKLEVVGASAKAIAAIEQAGGTVTVLGGPAEAGQGTGDAATAG